MGMAERIKELREQNEWTQEELGKRVGLQKSAIAKYENGRVSNMRRDVIGKMAEAFRVSPSYLMGFDDEEEKLNDLVKDDDLKRLLLAGGRAKEINPAFLEAVIAALEACKQ